MKLGLTTLLATALAAALLVPAAGATPGGNDNGQGPPAWAGAESGGAKANGKPDWAGKGQERRAAREAAQGEDQDGPKHQNPAWVCKFEREQMGDEAFADEYGTNDNKANAFGKCVSREAQERDGVTADEEETAAPGDEESTVPEDGESASADALAALQAFFQALSKLVTF
jgi:hypothetical protein